MWINAGVEFIIEVGLVVILVLWRTFCHGKFGKQIFEMFFLGGLNLVWN